MRILAASLVLLGLTSAVPARAPENDSPDVVIYAAASLRDALESVAPAGERATGAKLVFNFGPSNDLARQIEVARKADVFFSADEAWMDHLEKLGAVDAGSRSSPLSNRLVVVGRRDGSVRVASPEDLASPAIRWISLANPEAVPAGKYAKAWLEKIGQWEAVRERILPAPDVRAALAAVVAGGAEVGVVYRTDVQVSPQVRVLYEVPEGDAPRVSYALAAMKDRPHLEIVRRVVAFLAGAESAALFEKLGFIVTHTGGAH
ncbi:MAG TPA: molybdate ABC transporter substrate-binding protein [Verrucomicrobiae bacterium]|nr:molybdate ABC transporter substrate-binding protein [Verrucomicrobiae bacterium]